MNILGYEIDDKTSKYVINIGLSRTGTSTFQHTMNKSGYSGQHYPELIDLLTKRNRPFGALDDLGEAYSASDIICSAYFEVIHHLYKPDFACYFVYTTRDKESWVKSCEQREIVKKTRNLGNVVRKNNEKYLVRSAIFGQYEFDRQVWLDSYDRYEERVFRYFKNYPDQLLVLDIVGGDKPKKLYDFLDTPDEQRVYSEFPLVNKSEK